MQEEKTLWVVLKGEDLKRALAMAEEEKRSYSSLLRMALTHYWRTQYEVDAEEMAG